MSTDEPRPYLHDSRPDTRVDYLNVSFGWRSWLFTVDHKRIAILYLVVVTLMFFVGGGVPRPLPPGIGPPQAAVVEAGHDHKEFFGPTHRQGFSFFIP